MHRPHCGDVEQIPSSTLSFLDLEDLRLAVKIICTCFTKRISIVGVPIPFTVLLTCLPVELYQCSYLLNTMIKRINVEMINSNIRALLSTFNDADVEDCDTTREALSEMLTHVMRAAAVIRAIYNRDIKIDWTDQRAGLASSEVSYDRLTDPTELLVARTNLDWRDVENGGSCSIEDL